ncbi:ribose 5-phosphate isomerase B [candidate division WOR-3 bacterium JGI_Cruoil_03_44_89]|uniref:Ribose 5-phosphate isomerase B n=1 Tax=candidate division WOR-3 bacterium JGI_Cruoil_03_44_89 TaxID=1973748 RepID=A0A235BVW5_UNCW3|nr:MAG: ribose 5-phosphate isomerase B [candidate division WOR-3 bacterium JGI_Cruoil_03_44_89]
MKVIIGADHRGVELKEKVKAILNDKKIEYEDMGVSTTKSSDYPDIAIPLAKRVSNGEFERGILICNTGIGMCIAANKVKGAYAALCRSPEMARYARKHNNANIMTLSGEYTKEDELEKILMSFLETKFECKRHQRRFDKIVENENEWAPKEDVLKLQKQVKKWEKEAHHWQSRAWRR